MSVFEVKSSLLSLKPQVYGDDDHLYCESSLFAQMVSLFAHHRILVVDGVKRVVWIQTRSWWNRRVTIEIPFDRVQRIEYEFGSIGTFMLGVASVERFTISLALRDPEEDVCLATFDGAGSGIIDSHPLHAVVPELDACGDQGDASQTFVVALKRLLGVPIGLPVPRVADERGMHWQCCACKRPSPPRRAHCQYCGGPVAEEAARSETGKS